mgnify:FL=1
MALTKGERTTITTASSVANRMGVVPAYGGNPITTIAEVATEKLDFFAKRQATLQEGKYKADLEIQTRAYINEIGREYFDNPNMFIQKAGEYIDTLVDKAPVRYKSWTKSMAGSMAGTEGERIFDRRIKLDFLEAENLHNARVQGFNEKTINDMYNLIEYGDDVDLKSGNIANKVDLYKKNTYDPQLSEIYKDYLERYNSAYPEERSQMDTPEEFLRKMKLSFEQARINTKIKNMIDVAVLEIEEGGFEYTVGADILTELNSNITKMLNEEYMKNPQIDIRDGAATFIGSTTEERAEIIKNASSFAEAHTGMYKKQLAKYQLNSVTEKNQIHQRNLNGFIKSPEKYVSYNEDRLNADIVNLGLDEAAGIKYKNTFYAGKIVLDNVDKFLPKMIGGSAIMGINQTATETFEILQTAGYLDAVGIDTPADLKPLIIDTHMKLMFNAEELRDISTGKIDIFTYNEDGEKVRDENNALVATQQFNAIVAYASQFNEEIPVITDFLNDTISMTDTTDEESLDKLDKAAYMVHYFINENGFEYMFKGLTSENKAKILKLAEYHKLRSLNTSQVSRQDVANSFFDSLKTQTVTQRQEILTELDNFIYYGNEDETKGGINLTEMVNEYITKYQKMDLTSPFQANLFNELATGQVQSVLGDGQIDSVLVDQRRVQEVIRPLLNIYLPNMFTDSASVTKDSVKHQLEKVLPLIMEDFKNNGYNWKIW